MDEKLSGQIKQAADVLKTAGATEVYVFGSAATGRMRERADEVSCFVSPEAPEEVSK